MNKELKIEVGKFYKTRDGRKTRIYALDGKKEYPVHASILNKDGWTTVNLTLIGRLYIEGECNSDIVSEWVEPIEFDFSILPAWCDKCIAMDESGVWYCYQEIPFRENDVWFLNTDLSALAYEIPEKYAPKWKGNWKDSLKLNPKYK